MFDDKDLFDKDMNLNTEEVSNIVNRGIKIAKFGMFMWIAVVILVVGCWVGNVIKLSDCDFASPYKCEIIHGVGLLGPVAVVTVWFGTDADNAPKPAPETFKLRDPSEVLSN